MIRFCSDHTQRILYFWGLFVVLAMPSAALEFLADQVKYDNQSQKIILKGAIEIQSDQGYFYLSTLEYDTEAGKVIIDGNVRGFLKSGERIHANFVEIDQEKQQIILREAHIWLQSQMQLVMQKLVETSESSYAENIVASTCQVCSIAQTPLWQIRAQQVYRDKTAQKIYFRNARFELWGIPIAYFPAMRIPDSEVKRMTGFLTPKFIFSDIYGSAMKIPYYWNLTPSSDLQTAALVSTNDIQIFEWLYRQKTLNGQFEYQGALAADSQFDESLYYQYLEGHYSYKEDWKIHYSFTDMSDYNFAPNYGYALPSSQEFSISQQNDQSEMRFLATEYLPPSEAAAQREYPLIAPLIEFSHYDEIEGFVWKIDGQYVNYVSDIYEDYQFFSGGAAISTSGVLWGVMRSDWELGLRTFHSQIENASSQFEVLPYAIADFETPFYRSTSSGTHSLTPRLQLIWREPASDLSHIPHSENQSLAYDNISLFQPSTFIKNETNTETYRANLGLNYNYQSHNDFDFDLGLGRVWTTNQTLENSDDYLYFNQDYVGYFSLALKDNWNLYARTAFDENLVFSRREFGLNFSFQQTIIDVDWIAFAKDETIELNEAANMLFSSGQSQFHPNWQADWQFAYDLQKMKAKNLTLALIYGNECVQMRIGNEWLFDRGEGIAPERKLIIELDLIGLSRNKTGKWGQTQCNYQ